MELMNACDGGGGVERMIAVLAFVANVVVAVDSCLNSLAVAKSACDSDEVCGSGGGECMMGCV